MASTPTNTELLRPNYTSDTDAIKGVYSTWPDRENLVMGSPTDRFSKTRQSQVSDGGLSTMVMERTFRVMGTLPTGQVKALSQKDSGKAMLMDILIQRHVIPNACWGEEFLTKLRQWDFYSHVYGIMPMLYDWKVKDGYIGPDCRLIPMRDFTPQRGRTSMNDCDYVHIDTYHSVRELEEQATDKDSKWNKKELMTIVDAARAGDKEKPYDKMSSVERDRYNFVGGSRGDGARIRLITTYYSGTDGHWITWAPDYGDVVVRDLDNPHGTGKIPVVLKQSFPLVDSLYGLGDFERGESLQKAADALTNLYFDAVKMSVFSPLIVNPNGVVPHTLKYAAGARWLETIPNSIRPFQSSPQGMSTFQSTIGYIKGALNNQAGTTDTMINQDTSSDPSFGKTPEALQMQQARENSRDNWDRFFMEEALEQLLDGFCNLIANRLETPIDIHLFDHEIQAIIDAGYEDVNELIQAFDSGTTAQLTITSDQLQNDGKPIPYKYYIDAKSTKAKDDKEETENIMTFLSLFSKIPNLDTALQAQGKKIDFGNALKLLGAKAGIADIDKIVVDMNPQEMYQAQLAQQSAGTAVGQSSDAAGVPNPGQALQPGAGQAAQGALAPPADAQAQPFEAHGQVFHDPQVAATAAQLFQQ